jgi:hypothetical protein
LGEARFFQKSLGKTFALSKKSFSFKARPENWPVGLKKKPLRREAQGFDNKCALKTQIRKSLTQIRERLEMTAKTCLFWSVEIALKTL